MPGSVLYLTAEDGLGDTLRPRLEALGADLTRIHVLDGIIAKDGARDEFTLADIDVLREALAKTRPTLVVVDPIQAYVGPGVDMWRPNEVRPVLAALARLAEEFECAVVAVRHLRKGTADRAVHRGLGSIDFSAAARSILLVAEDPQDSARRVLAHVKCNLAPLGPSLGFEINEGALRWLGASSLRAEDLLATSAPTGARRPRAAATDFLLEALGSHEPVAVADLRSEASAAGLSWRTVERAKAEVGAVARKSGFGEGAQWFWVLPGGCEDRQAEV